MRIALLSPCFSDRYHGGVQLSARLAFEALAAAEPVRFLCYGPDCAAAARNVRPENASILVCSHSKPAAVFTALRHRTWPDRLLFWHADLLKLMPFLGTDKRRKILFLHGIECWREMDAGSSRLLDEIDLFLSNSDFTWTRFIALNPRWAARPHRTVPLGLGAPQAASESSPSETAAVMIGRMSKNEAYKGHEQVIRAWPRVIDAVPGAELWIAGGGDAVDDLGRLARDSDARANIRFLGVIPDKEKETVLRRSRCLVMPSRGEGFGLVYLEAMRLGRPCLAGIHDAGREVVGAEAGLAADPDHAETLSRAIARLLTPGPQWDRWSAGARARYESTFTAAHFQQRLIEAVTAETAA